MPRSYCQFYFQFVLGNGLKPTTSKSGELTFPWIQTNEEVLHVSDLKSNQMNKVGLLAVLLKTNYVQSRDFIMTLFVKFTLITNQELQSIFF